MPTWIAPFKPAISALILPPGLFVLMLCASALLLVRKRQRSGLTLLLAVVVCLWLGQSVAVARWLQTTLLDMPSILTPADVARLKRADVPTAIIVLGGGMITTAPEFEGGPELAERSLMRLRYAVHLARATGLPLGYTGGAGWMENEGSPPETAAALRALTDWGYALRWREDNSRDTRENARLTVPMLQKDGIREIVLVTDGVHMPRVLRAFREAAGDSLVITPAPTAFLNGPVKSGLEWFPSDRGGRFVAFALHEWVGLLAGQ